MPRGILWAVLQEPIAVPPIYSCGSPHHITLFYDVDKSEYSDLIGIEFNTFTIANCYDADIQTLLCDIPSRIPHKPNPHITISYREGIEPKASNDMLIGKHTAIPLEIPLKLRIEFYEFPECQHLWVKNGTRNGLQRYKCKHCGASMTDLALPIGRPKKELTPIPPLTIITAQFLP